MVDEAYVRQRRKPISWLGHIYEPGAHVTGWAGLIPGWGEQAAAIRDTFFTSFLALELAGVYFSLERVHLAGLFSEGRERLIIHKRVGKDARAVTILISTEVASNKRGDLEVAWFWFEKDRAVPLKWISFGVIVLVLGYLFSNYMAGFGTAVFGWFILPLMVGVWFVGRGMGWWGRLYKTSPATPYERFDAAVLARYVDATLKTTLREAGIDETEIQELRLTDISWIEERRRAAEVS